MKPIAAVVSAVAMAAAACLVATLNPPAYALTPPGATTTTTAAATTSTATATATPKPPPCPTRSRRFAPKWVSMQRVVKRAVAVAPPRVNGVPGSPPLTSAGKWQVAWDRKWPVRPGDPYGQVLLNAHVWPDGSAIGNRMLSRLKVGARIVIHGDHRMLCYRVTRKIQVYPKQALRRYYRSDGRPGMAIVVCSGRRLGPGVWEKRTIWFAVPRA